MTSSEGATRSCSNNEFENCLLMVKYFLKAAMIIFYAPGFLC